jgi:hypothetical protein
MILHSIPTMEVSTVSDVSRREFLQKGSVGVVAGVAAIGGLAELKTERAHAAKAHATHDQGIATSSDPVVAYVRPGGREVTIMVGTREVVHRDPELVRRLLRVAT